MLADDYKEVHNVYMNSVSQAVLTSRDKPIRNIADLKGAKVLTPGAAFAPIVGAWGASPVPMDLNEMFNALSTGVVDMVALPATSLTPPFRLAEIAFKEGRLDDAEQGYRRAAEASPSLPFLPGGVTARRVFPLSVYAQLGQARARSRGQPAHSRQDSCKGRSVRALQCRAPAGAARGLRVRSTGSGTRVPTVSASSPK